MFESLACWDELPPLPESPPDHDAPLTDADLVAAVSECWREPSAELVSVLAAVPVRELSADAALDVLAGWDRVRSWVDGQCYQLLAVIADADDSAEEWCREQVAAVLGLAPITAHDRLRVARALARDLPATRRLLLTGQLTGRHAVAVADAAEQLPAGRATDLEAAVLARALTQTVPELRRSLARAVLRLDPAGAQRRAAAAHRTRCVRVRDAPDGMAELWALLPAADAHAIAACLDTTARTLHQTHRAAHRAAAAAATDASVHEPAPGLDALRADALVAAVLGTADPAPDGHPAGRRPLIHVTVALTTLTGADDEPGHLTGYGPVTADTARDLAHDPTGTWRRLITDPTGTLTDYDTTRYRPPGRLTGLAVHRYGTCTFPGCARAAHRCDLDHATAHREGGPTATHNLHPLCRRHHRLKHTGRWHPTLHPDTTVGWTSPHGHTYTTRPPERWPTPTG